ncbi:MAG: S41 family peptidase [Mucilaginibacter sp.]|jgi:C-terminal processing protease CtpA/Prc|uniref:S41 family peptidase n=1 Tax=Mucilaginibacter sp. TaxID=1882438 RepID=UPI003561BA9E
MRKIFYLSLLVVTVAIASCSKDKKITPTDNGGNNNGNNPTVTASALDLIKDSVFLYAQQVYYWNTSLPTYDAFKPRSFTGSNDIDALQTEIDAMTQYSTNPETGKPYEYYTPAPGYAKYSFIDDGSVSGELNGIKGDFGFAPVWIDANTDIRVKYVYPGSPADVKGLKRGYQITAINGRTGSGLKYDGGAGGSGTNVNFLINAYSNSSTINLTLKKPDGNTFDVTLSTGTYTVNPVLTSKIVDAGNNKKVGYIVFNSFTSKANAKPYLDAAFNSFSAGGITDLVVDLRYNGGGFVETAQYLSNLIAPASTNGSTMFTYNFTKTMADGKATILKNQLRKDGNQIYSYFDFDYTIAGNTVKFSKTDVPVTLNLNHVFFIVTGSTASASELTINNLIPVMDVQLIGTTTYGKPVGFFDIDINKYQMYIPQFETKNSAGNGGYYAGMTPEKGLYRGKLYGDDASKDFGDPTESLFSYALNYVKNGNFSLPQQQIQSLSRLQKLSVDQSREVGLQVEGKKYFRGMIYNNTKAKK